MKRTLALILCAALCMAAVFGAAESGDPDAPVVSDDSTAETASPSNPQATVETPEGFICRMTDSGTAEITGYAGTDLNAVIPDAVTFEEGREPVPVTRLAAWAFEESPVVSVVVPYGVTEIGAFCFSECGSLEAIDLPESLRSLGTCAFILCVKLKEVTLPSSLTAVGDNPFCYCTGLENILLAQPDRADDAAEDDAFNQNRHPVLDFSDGLLIDREEGRLITRLSTAEGQRFTLPEGCAIIGAYALANNRQLTEVIIPATVTAIGRYAFYHCTSLRSASVDASVETVGEHCFDLCHEELTITASEGSAAWVWALANGIMAETPAPAEIPDALADPEAPIVVPDDEWTREEQPDAG